MTTVAVAAERLSPRRRTVRKFRLATSLACGWIVLVVLATVLAPLLASQGSDAQDLTARSEGPSAHHILGTDELGRDLLVRLLYGARPMIEAVIIVLVVTVGIGATTGLAAGYVRGRVDGVLSAIFDVLQSVPAVLISLVVFAIFPYRLSIVMAATAVFMSPFIYRVVRGATLSLGSELYVTSARATGLSQPAIIWRHLTPRLAELLRVQASIMAAVAITTEVGLGFLGLDVAPPDRSWGGLVADGTQYLAPDPWMILPPLVAIAITIVAFGVLGEVVQSPAETPSRWRRRTRPVRGVVLVPRGGSGGPSIEEVATEQPADTIDVAANMAAEGVLLRVRGLRVSTNGPHPVDLVDHVSFDVRRGEVLGIVGESGAGKSVIVRSLVRVFRNTTVRGSVVLDGVDLVDAGEDVLAKVRGKRIAYVGQDPLSALDPLFRIGNQLVEAVRTHRRLGKSEARAEALRLLKAVRIPSAEDVLRKYPFEISGGQAQRIAIALALAGEPELLIADEPTTALDVTIQMEVLGLLKELQKERELSIILVTHDWGVVADMCDRVLTVYAGEIVETGEIRDVFKHPAHPYTSALRQADPHLQPEGVKLRVIPGRMPSAPERPDGCRFAARCPLMIEACKVHPPLVRVDEVVDVHASRCVRAIEVRQSAHV